MAYVDDVKKAWSLICCPSKMTGGKYTIGEALKFYYTATLIPVLLTILFGYFGVWTNTIAQTSAFVPFMAGLGGYLSTLQSLIASVLLLFWAIIPLGFFVNAMLYQLVGKNFLGVFKQGYARSFTALVFGSMPYVLLFWLFLLPVVNIAAFVILSLWNKIVEVIAFSSQQKVSRLQAIGVMFTLVALAVLAILLLFTAIIMVRSAGSCGLAHPCPVPGLW